MQFRQIWAVDFEFHAPAGERPQVICVAARELHSGRFVRQWLWDGAPPEPPFSLSGDSLFIAYHASAELSCHLALNWEFPAFIVDLEAEFRLLTNGVQLPYGRKLLGAMAYFGLDSLSVTEKKTWQSIAIRGGPFSNEERNGLLDYCQTDVDALAKLFPAMQAGIDWPRALLRGRYTQAVARVEWTGVPLDKNELEVLREHWDTIKEGLVSRIDPNGEIYEGTIFKIERFKAWLQRRGIHWFEHTPTGEISLEDKVFREMSKAYPRELGPIRDLRHSLSQLKLHDLAVGTDGRNRTLLSQFCSSTGRNQPSSSQYIFGNSVWVRSLIRPQPGRALGYIDWSQQEFGIAAALSEDPAMCAAYSSGDPYLAFAKQAGAVPPEATKQSHAHEREMFKVMSLAVQYGMGGRSLGQRLNDCDALGFWLIRQHKHTYPKYWKWSESAVMRGMLHGSLSAAFGWTLHITSHTRSGTVRNFPLQGNGSEMLRLACVFGTEAGITITAPVHDAVLIESPVDRIEHDVHKMQECMRRASEFVLAGFPLRTDAKIIRYPDRYVDERGKTFWKVVWDLIRESRGEGVPDEQVVQKWGGGGSL
jgi:DNA polymerase I